MNFLRRIQSIAVGIIDSQRELFSLSALGIYFATFIAETPVFFFRCFVVFVVFGLIGTAKGDAHLGETWIWLGLLPCFWSAIALVTPIGTGWWWKQRLGGRKPSGRESLAYEDALDLLQAHREHPLVLPGSWFVLDEIQPDAAVCGRTLMLSSGLLQTDMLPAVLAHELGHLASPDGRLTAAVNRLVLWTRSDERRPRTSVGEIPRGEGWWIAYALLVVGRVFRSVLTGIRGGLGLRILGPVWGNYWRTREYAADAYAAALGQADELADFLESYALINDHPVPFIWLSEHTHPPSELRIDRLRSAAVAPGSEPVKAVPAGPPAAGPDGPALTEPDPCAERSIRSAGRTLPTFRGHKG